MKNPNIIQCIKKCLITAIPCCLLFTLNSCNTQPNEKGEFVIKPNENSKELRVKYNENGGFSYIQEYKNNIPEGINMNFFPNGNIKHLAYLKDEKINGIGIVFHNNGVINNVGKHINGEKSGWFYVFDKDGNLINRREYIIINNKSYLNQWIAYRPDGSIDKYESLYISINTPKDTIQQGEEFKMQVNLEGSLFKQHMLLIIGPFDENFSLNENALCDTIPCKNFSASYSLKNYKKGINTIRGIVAEIKKSEQQDKINVRKIYFSKNFMVR